MKHADGSPIVLHEETEAWRTYFSTFLGGRPDPVPPAALPPPATVDLPISTVPEVARALQKSSSGGAPGLDGLTMDVLQLGGPPVPHALMEILNAVFSFHASPYLWRESIIAPLPKQ